ncbi:MAG: hypothetical protein U1F87_03110 [Kiritimatiellia bacterium]
MSVAGEGVGQPMWEKRAEASPAATWGSAGAPLKWVIEALTPAATPA